MTLVLKHDLAKMYYHTKNEVSKSFKSYRPNGQTHKQYENITFLRMRAIKNVKTL